MCTPEKFFLQTACGLAKREPRARPPCCQAARISMEFAGDRARIGRLVLLAAALSLALAGCQTTTSVPSSPFLTAVARLPVLRANPGPDGATANLSAPAAKADAAATETLTTGSLSPAAAPPSGRQNTEQARSLKPVGSAPIEPAADRAGVSVQIASVSPRMVDAVTAARTQAPMPRQGSDAAGSTHRKEGNIAS